MNPTPVYFIGIMSGTSLDGVDAVLADLCSPIRVVGHSHTPYSHELRARLLQLNHSGAAEIERSQALAVELSGIYAATCRNLLHKLSLTADQIQAIGCHGQTIRHRPDLGYSIQLNQPANLAELTDITVVADFRSRDIAAGGQGAPLVPAFHDSVFRTTENHVVVLNLGGIANITDLHPARPTAGFDTGPANILMDAWIEYHQGVGFDQNGNWAACGNVSEILLAQLLNHPFFDLPPPKSCGREEFSLQWLQANLGDQPPADVQATLLELSARSICDATLKHCGKPDRLLICGGGARNRRLLSRLGELLEGTTIAITDDYGITAECVEACAFAWLAARTLANQAGNLPKVTGAKGPRILGAIYPK